MFFSALGSIEHWKLFVFSDTAHANLDVGISNIGSHIVLWVGSKQNCCPLAWQANKIKRICAFYNSSRSTQSTGVIGK